MSANRKQSPEMSSVEILVGSLLTALFAFLLLGVVFGKFSWDILFIQIPIIYFSMVVKFFVRRKFNNLTDECVPVFYKTGEFVLWVHRPLIKLFYMVVGVDNGKVEKRVLQDE